MVVERVVGINGRGVVVEDNFGVFGVGGRVGRIVEKRSWEYC